MKTYNAAIVTIVSAMTTIFMIGSVIVIVSHPDTIKSYAVFALCVYASYLGISILKKQERFLEEEEG